MLPVHAPATLQEIAPGKHLCQLYETEAEYKAITATFIAQGLRKGEKVIYAIEAHPADVVLSCLREADVNVEAVLASGQLTLVPAHNIYTPNEIFNPDTMLQLINTALQDALDEGYTGLRALGEMSWVFHTAAGAEHLLEYEARLNELFASGKLALLCQYDRRRFGPATLLGALRTHPVAIVGTQVYDNVYYVPMLDIPNTDMPSWAFQQWLENLAAHQRKEKDPTQPFSKESRAAADRVLRNLGLLTSHEAESNVRLYIP